MTPAGYDYEYALTTWSHDPGGYGSYNLSAITAHMEVTVDPPEWSHVREPAYLVRGLCSAQARLTWPWNGAGTWAEAR